MKGYMLQLQRKTKLMTVNGKPSAEEKKTDKNSAFLLSSATTCNLGKTGRDEGRGGGGSENMAVTLHFSPYVAFFNC